MADDGNGATQEYIITALLQLLHKKAFAQISVTEVCRKAGVSRMSFYRHFESREDVLKSGARRSQTSSWRSRASTTGTIR